MYKKQLLFERELRFTDAYRTHYNDNKAWREYYALEQQIPYYFIEPREHDLIAGRIDRPMIMFAPCTEGDYIDKVGYGIDETLCAVTLE
ncbi:MAG: hypothetical protein WDA65_09455, partial [Christensenellales bacterium]